MSKLFLKERNKRREKLREKTLYRSSHRRCSEKQDVLRNFAKFTGKHLWQRLFFNKVAGASSFIKKETPTQVFSCEFCEITTNIFFYRTPRVAASEY